MKTFSIIFILIFSFAAFGEAQKTVVDKAQLANAKNIYVDDPGEQNR